MKKIFSCIFEIIKAVHVLLLLFIIFIIGLILFIPVCSISYANFLVDEFTNYMYKKYIKKEEEEEEK